MTPFLPHPFPGGEDLHLEQCERNSRTYNVRLESPGLAEGFRELVTHTQEGARFSEKSSLSPKAASGHMQ